MKNGKGVLKTKDYTYEGYFKDNMKDGEGKITFANNCEFTGTFKENKK